MPSTARDWMLTISAEKHTQQAVEELLDVLGAYIFQQEEGGETGYPHFQAFLQLQSPIHMKTLKNKFKKAGFNDAHIEMRKGTVQDCIDYCGYSLFVVGDGQVVVTALRSSLPQVR